MSTTPPGEQGLSRRAYDEMMRRYGRGASRLASIYAIGTAAVLPFGLLSLAVTTRYLPVAEYGRLAVLFATAAVTTLIAGLGVVQGTIMLVYRQADEGGDDDGGGDDGADLVGWEEADQDKLSTREKRRLLGSGMTLVILSATTITAPFAIFAPGVSSLLLGSPGYAGDVRWMAFSAWSGAVWRMCHQVWRLERRPGVWLGFQALRPALSVIGTVIALEAGMGIAGPLAATAIGTVIASLASVWGSRRCYAFAPKIRDFIEIWKIGRRFVGIQSAGVIQGHLSVFLLTALSSASQVGVYTVALRLSIIPSYFAHGFFLAWPSIDGSPIGIAAKQRKGRPEHAASVFSLLWFVSLGLMFVVSVSAAALVTVFAPGYGPSVDLIPLLAAAELGHLMFKGIYRASRFHHRRRWYVSLHFIWLIPYLIFAIALLPFGPTWALATATVLASVLISLVLLRLDHRGGRPTPFQWGRLGAATLVAIAGILVVEVSPVPAGGRMAIGVGALVAFPMVLVRLGVIPRRQVGLVFAIIRGLFPSRPPRGIAHRLRELPEREREVVDGVLRGQGNADEMAVELGVRPDIVRARLVRGLRRVSGSSPVGIYDAEIGRYLLSTAMALERDADARLLTKRGVDPLELDRLASVKKDIERVRL